MPGIIPSNPTRFPNGINNSPMLYGNHPGNLYWMGQPDVTAYQNTHDDFNVYSATTYTVTGTGTVAQATLLNNVGGVVTITNSAASGDAQVIQLATAPYLPVVNKRTFFKCRISVDDATLTGFMLGLVAGTPTAANAITDGIYLYKAGATNTLTSAFVRQNATTGSNSLTGLPGLVAGYNTLGWHFDGKQSVEFFINDVKVATVAATSGFLPDAALAPAVAVFNGSAVSRIMLLDYIFVSQER